MAAAALFSPRPLAGQRVVTSAGWQEATVGSELERYLRILQLAGKSPVYPWSVRGFSPREIDGLAPRDSLHPWAARLGGGAPDSTQGLRVAILRPEVHLTFNSAFPWAENDGVVWAGRGLTSAIQAGVQARYGPLTLTLRPIAFRAENDAFPLMPNGLTGDRRFANGVAPGKIDLPQRFGSGPYERIDFGQSSLALDLYGVALGVSTGSEIWGPAFDQSLVLGAGAPGFTHAFIGTVAPVNVGVGHLHGRLIVGRLEQSAYSPAPSGLGSRLAAGLVATFSPRWTPGLELGLTRFFHQRWPTGGLLLSDFLIPLRGFFLKNSAQKYNPSDPNYTPQNQIASVFSRWAFPSSGLEIYGEYARDDRNANTRDLLSEPDHISAYTIGLVKLLRRSARSYSVVRAELANGRVTDLARLRPESGFYVHAPIDQGHTNRGQLLGSPAVALGGDGATIGLDVYQTDGRWTLEGTRMARPLDIYAEGAASGRGWDVSYALKAERLLFLQGWEITAAVTGVFDLNRNFSHDAFDLRLDVGSRFGF